MLCSWVSDNSKSSDSRLLLSNICETRYKCKVKFRLHENNSSHSSPMKGISNRFKIHSMSKKYLFFRGICSNSVRKVFYWNALCISDGTKTGVANNDFIIVCPKCMPVKIFNSRHNEFITSGNKFGLLGLIRRYRNFVISKVDGHGTVIPKSRVNNKMYRKLRRHLTPHKYFHTKDSLYCTEVTLTDRLSINGSEAENFILYDCDSQRMPTIPSEKTESKKTNMIVISLMCNMLLIENGSLTPLCFYLKKSNSSVNNTIQIWDTFSFVNVIKSIEIDKTKISINTETTKKTYFDSVRKLHKRSLTDTNQTSRNSSESFDTTPSNDVNPEASWYTPDFRNSSSANDSSFLVESKSSSGLSLVGHNNNTVHVQGIQTKYERSYVGRGFTSPILPGSVGGDASGGDVGGGNIDGIGSVGSDDGSDGNVAGKPNNTCGSLRSLDPKIIDPEHRSQVLR